MSGTDHEEDELTRGSTTPRSTDSSEDIVEVRKRTTFLDKVKGTIADIKLGVTDALNLKKQEAKRMPDIRGTGAPASKWSLSAKAQEDSIKEAYEDDGAVREERSVRRK